MPFHPSAERHNQLIAKYFILNMGDYSEVGSPLSSILDRLDINKTLSAKDKQWIRDKGMFTLLKFVDELEKTGKSDFWILRARIENRRKRNVRQELWEQYDIDYIDSHHVRPMITILLKLEEGNRLVEKDVLWLSSNDYFFEYRKIRQKYHLNEALYYHERFRRSRDPWQAVNTSSHYRKARLPQEAVKILGTIDASKHHNKHLKSALCTTNGGCMRDLHQFTEAITLAERAHSFDADSFHPCTLLGALYYDTGQFSIGDEWFAKAIDRGADIGDVDQEVRSIFLRADKIKREQLKRHLLSVDPQRYSWVNNLSRDKEKRRKNA